MMTARWLLGATGFWAGVGWFWTGIGVSQCSTVGGQLAQAFSGHALQMCQRYQFGHLAAAVVAVGCVLSLVLTFVAAKRP